MTLDWQGDEVLARVAEAKSQALQRAGELVLRESNAISPTESGELDDTGHVVVDGDEAAVAYESEKARKQHEMTYYRHPRGDQPKFLERTISNQSERILNQIAATMRAALGG